MRNSYINITGSGVVINGEGVLSSMYVNSTSSGAFKLNSGITGADTGTPIGGTITPAAGFHFLGNILSTAGIYCNASAGSFDITFHIQNKE